MPTTINIPARRERKCEPCEHLRRQNILCSRLHGISCDYACGHPEAFGPDPRLEDPAKAKLYGELVAHLKESGRVIGRNDKQPEWCPLRREDGHNAPDQR